MTCPPGPGGTLSLEKSESPKDRSGSESHGWLEVLQDRREHTLGGCLIGTVQDILDFGKAKADIVRSANAEANDELAKVAADTLAFLPSMKWTAGGALRAAILVNPHEGAGENLAGFGKNFLEGAALNKVGRLALPEGAFSKALTARLGDGLLSESVAHLSVGFGIGAVKSGFNQVSWKDEAGTFSLA